MDFPVLEDPPVKPAPTTALAVVSVKDAALAKFSQTERDLRALAQRYADVAFDVSNPKGLKEAKAARTELREGRFAVQRIEQATKDELNGLKKDLKEHADRLVAIVRPTEEAVHAQVEAREAEIAAEKQREEDRKQRHTENLQRIAGYGDRAIGQPVDKLEAAITYVEGIGVSEAAFEEYAAAAATAKEGTLGKLRAALEKAREDARVRAENEARERTIQQLSALSSAVTDCMGQSALFIELRLRTLTLPDGAAPEVAGAYMNARVQLDMLLTAARQNEALRAPLEAARPQATVPPGPAVAAPEVIAYRDENTGRAVLVDMPPTEEELNAPPLRPEPVVAVQAPLASPTPQLDRLEAAIELAERFGGRNVNGRIVIDVAQLADLIDHVREA
jgi:hypothetical protein